MGTTERRFYPAVNDWDGTDPASGDVRACETSLPTFNANSSCDFGTSGSKTITVDPYTAGRTTTGLDSGFGWAIDIAGADGMDGTADAKRRIAADAWLFQGNIGGSVASLNACTVAVNVYRVAAAPSTTRTLLFSASTNAGLVAIRTVGTSWSIVSSSQPELVLEAGETIQVTFTLTCTGQAGGLVIDFNTGNSVAQNDTYFDVPSPGVRTQFQETISTVGVGTASVLDGVKIVSGVLRDSLGDPVDAATAKLFDQSTDTRISTFTTGGDGAYQFTRTDNDTATYFIVGYSDDTHHGTSDRGLTAQPE